MASGVKVNKSCTDTFEEMKMKKMHRYVVFKLNEKLSEVVVDCTGERDTTYDNLKAYLLEVAEARECRYAAMDLDFEFNGKPKNKIVFIAWSPEGAQMKQKMVYTSSKDYIKKALQLVNECQATDADELSWENLVEKAQRGMKD